MSKEERFKYYYNESAKRYEVFDCYVNLALSKKGIIELLNDQQDKIVDLEAKLAESKKEKHEEWKTGKEWKWEWQRVNQQVEQAYQDKIEFAIEQLEKVKNYIITDEKDIFGATYLMKSGYVLEYIDNQIKQLKRGDER